MIGAVIFVIFFLIFTLVSVFVYPDLPPAAMILGWFGITAATIPQYGIWIIGLINGVIYGFIIWLIYSLIRVATRKEKVERALPPKAVLLPHEPLAEPVVRATAPNPLERGIDVIKGIGPSYADKLKGANLTVIKDILKAGGTKKGRETLAKITGASERTVLKWVNRADLFRVKGIGKEYSELLDVAGVNTVVELSRRNPAKLREKLEEINREKGLVKQLPSVETIGEWIRHAKRLKRRVEY
jgi:predicted flap endonuclease-1-like 5' DNA nuclease